MKLDLTRPTLVMTGAWNVAIFSPGWIAKNLFGYPVGAEVPTAQVIGTAGDAVRQITYIKNLGLRPDGKRIELYANSGSEAHFQRLETYAVQLLTVLPHTPVGSMGINFHFTLANAPDDVLNRLDTHEGLSHHYEVRTSQIRSQISVDENYVCNVERTATEDGTLIVDLNYHFEKFGETTDKAQVISGAISAKLAHARTMLAHLYDQDDVEPAGHDFAEMANQWEE